MTNPCSWKSAKNYENGIGAQVEIRMLGDAYLVAGRPADARDAAQRALDLGGPHDEEARELHRQAKLALHRQEVAGRQR